MADRALDSLAGCLTVYPGRARPHNLVSTRPDWVNKLAQGKRASVLPDLLASLFSLCGHAHRLCANLAIQAAHELTDPPTPTSSQSLQMGTLTEHLRAVCLDWPRHLTIDPGKRTEFQERAMGSLRTCPTSLNRQSSESRRTVAGLSDWIGQQLLGMAPSIWLEKWERDPWFWMRQWSSGTRGWLPELLRDCMASANTIAADVVPLRVQDNEKELRELARQIRTRPQFSQLPLWRDQCAETGTWTRTNQEAPKRFDTPWLRLGARLAESVRLALPDESKRCGAQWLQTGSICVGKHEGLAWVEMARGLLIHHVQLDGGDINALTTAYHVVAPTEWNFHPRGAVAHRLEDLSKRFMPDMNQRILTLMTAYDPCVEFQIRSTESPQGDA